MSAVRPDRRRRAWIAGLALAGWGWACAAGSGPTPADGTYLKRVAFEMPMVTARWRGGHVADLHDVHQVLLHEMGHALGLGGHSDERADVMFPKVNEAQRGLTVRDRATLAAVYSRPIGKQVLGARPERAY